jgi:hypothetical protein
MMEAGVISGALRNSLEECRELGDAVREAIVPQRWILDAVGYYTPSDAGPGGRPWTFRLGPLASADQEHLWQRVW